MLRALSTIYSHPCLSYQEDTKGIIFACFTLGAAEAPYWQICYPSTEKFIGPEKSTDPIFITDIVLSLKKKFFLKIRVKCI